MVTTSAEPSREDLVTAVKVLATVIRDEYPPPRHVDFDDGEGPLSYVTWIYSSPGAERLAALRRVEAAYPEIGDWNS